MNKKVIQLLALLGVLILLVVGYLVLTSVTEPEEDTAVDDALAGNTYNVCAVDQKTVHRISYTAGGREYVYSLKDDATGWVWNEDPTLPLDNLFFANMVTACGALTSTVRLTDVTAASLVEYGLADNALRLVFADGVGERAYRVGAYNSYNGMRYFCTESDLTTVYMVASTVADAFAYTPYDMIKIPDLPTDITAANLVHLTMTPAEGSLWKPLVCTYYSGGKAEGERDVWYISVDGGEEKPLDATTGEALSTALTTMAFSSLVSYKADEQAALGLDTPTVMTVDYKVTQNFQDDSTGKTTSVNVDKSFTLLLGDIDTADGLLFATVEGSPLTCKLMGDVFGELLRSTASAPIS